MKAEIVKAEKHALNFSEILHESISYCELLGRSVKFNYHVLEDVELDLNSIMMLRSSNDFSKEEYKTSLLIPAKKFKLRIQPDEAAEKETMFQGSMSIKIDVKLNKSRN